MSVAAAISLVATVLVSSAASAAPLAAVETCGGKVVTIDMNTNGGNGTGTADADVILGTPNGDLISSAAGNDTICGGGGDDTIRGGPGADFIIGGDGDDLIFGGGGNDALYGSAGDDEIFGQFGGDTIRGEAGDDRLLGGVGFDTMYGGDDDDFVQGSGGNDSLFGGAGNDALYGKTGDDYLHGDAGDDELYGASGDDNINGGAGADLLHGAQGADDLRGHDGNDVLYGKAGNDTMLGGSGDDELYGASGDDVMYGNAGDDRMLGGSDDDTLYGSSGDDELFGQSGADYLDGGPGTNAVFGGPGADEVAGVALPGAGRSISLGRAHWSSGFVQAQIVHDVLEELGYDVTSPSSLELTPNRAYRAMASGDMDLWANSWYRGHESWWEDTLEDGTRVGDRLSRLNNKLVAGGGLQGMLVTKAWAEADNFTTIDQINADSRLWSKLDSDGNGKGEIYGCPEDWTCDDIINSQISFANWTNLEQVQGGYDAMFTEFIRKARAGEPAIIYTWTPTYYHAEAALGDTTMWLSMNDASVLNDSNPLNIDGGEDFCQRCELDGTLSLDIGYRGRGADVCLIGPNGCQLGWTGSDIEITTNANWLTGNPPARTLLEAMAIPAIDISRIGVELANSDGSEADVERLAAEWIANNRALVDGWLTAAGVA